MTDVTIATLRADQSLHDAFRAAGASGDRLAVIVDGEGRVTATVTDGDIRRAVLAGRALDAPLSQVVSAPLLLSADDPDDAVRDLFLRSGRSAIAVVDSDRRLVGVRRLADVAPELAVGPVGVLMVGGRGERLRPLTDKMPKPLLKIGGAAIVERLIGSMRSAGVSDVYLTVNYMAEQFEERLGDGSGLGVHLHYVREEQPLDTAGALSLLPSQGGRPLLVSNGDLVTTIDFGAMLDFHRFHRSAITVAGVEYAATVPYGVLRTAEHHLLHIDEKPTSRQLVSGGIYVLSPDVLRFVPHDRPFKMPDLIDCALRDGLGVNVFPVLERWSDIGSKEEFERVLFEFAVEEEN